MRHALAEPVIGGALLRIAQAVIGLADRFEARLAVAAPRILVGVIFHRELAITRLQRRVVGGALAFEQFVIIDVERHNPNAPSAPPRVWRAAERVSSYFLSSSTSREFGVDDIFVGFRSVAIGAGGRRSLLLLLIGSPGRASSRPAQVPPTFQSSRWRRRLRPRSWLRQPPPRSRPSGSRRPCHHARAAGFRSSGSGFRRCSSPRRPRGVPCLPRRTARHP